VPQHSDESSDSKVVDMFVLPSCAKYAYHSQATQDKEIRNTRFTTEVRAGLTTFFTMAYVISVNVSLNTQEQSMADS
jgi:hypothetical protein